MTDVIKFNIDLWSSCYEILWRFTKEAQSTRTNPIQIDNLICVHNRRYRFLLGVTCDTKMCLVMSLFNCKFETNKKKTQSTYELCCRARNLW